MDETLEGWSSGVKESRTEYRWVTEEPGGGERREGGTLQAPGQQRRVPPPGAEEQNPEPVRASAM